MRDIAIAYVGSMVPDRDEFKTSAYSIAGNIFQRDFLRALEGKGAQDLAAYSLIAMASFPRDRRLAVLGRPAEMWPGLTVHLLGFLNFGVLKTLTLGIGGFSDLLRWGLAKQDRPRRVVFCYNLTAPPAAFIRLACRLTRTPLVGILQDINVPGEMVSNSLLRRIEFAWQRRLIPKLDGLVVANEAMVEDFAPGRPYVLMAGGVPEDFLQRFSTRRRCGDEGLRMAFAGRLTQLNGLDMIVGAFERCSDAPWTLEIAGDGPLRRLVEEAALRDPRIHYHGILGRDDVIDLYQRSNLLLCLRRTDQRMSRYVFPSKLVECLATGIPVLSTPVGHAAREFGPFLSILEEESDEALASRFAELAREPAEGRERRAWEGRDHIRAKRTWPAYMEQLEAYLREHVLGPAG